jgi:hypothetical protein
LSLSPPSTNSDAEETESIASTIQLQSSVPHGNILRALVTVTWRGHFDEVFVKVNGWPEQASLRTPVEIVFDLIDPERQNLDRAVPDFVKSQVFDPGDVTAQLDGIARLNPKLARRVPKIFLPKLDDPAGRFRSSADPGIALQHH